MDSSKSIIFSEKDLCLIQKILIKFLIDKSIKLIINYWNNYLIDLSIKNLNKNILK